MIGHGYPNCDLELAPGDCGLSEVGCGTGVPDWTGHKYRFQSPMERVANEPGTRFLDEILGSWPLMMQYLFPVVERCVATVAIGADEATRTGAEPIRLCGDSQSRNQQAGDAWRCSSRQLGNGSAQKSRAGFARILQSYSDFCVLCFFVRMLHIAIIFETQHFLSRV